MRKTQLVQNLQAELEAIKCLNPNVPITEQLNLVSATLKSVEELLALVSEDLRQAS